MRKPTQADYDDIIGKCERTTASWCRTHDSYCPSTQARCNRRLDDEDTVERLLERVKCDEGDERYTQAPGPARGPGARRVKIGGRWFMSSRVLDRLTGDEP